MDNQTIELDKVREKKINNLLSIRNLPSIPVVMFEVTKLLENPKTNANDLGKIISMDQGLVAKILTVANSPLYGLPRRVATIEFAVVILGFEHIKNIVIALSMIEAFKGKDDKDIDKKSYWLHSLVTAFAAKRIADDFRYRKSGEAFTAGLLHDLGISVIQRFFNPDFLKIVELVRKNECDYLNAENQILGINHQDIGQFLIEKWNLPPILGDVILHHHDPSKAENKQLSAIVHLADYMTQKLGIGAFNWDENMKYDPFIMEVFGFSDESNLDSYIAKHQDLFLSQIELLEI
jgi:HD-like signal output (HDOD) protein